MDKEAIEQKAAEFVNKNYKKAVELAKKNQEISILSLQKTYKVSYTQATALFNKLIEENVISKTSDKKAKSNVFVEPKTTTDKKPTATKKANAKPATTVKKTAKAADKKKTEKQDPAYAKAVEFVKSNKEFNYGLFQETMQTNKTQTDSLLDQLINDNVVSFTKKGQKPIYKAKEAEKKSTKQNSKPKKVKKEVVQEEPQNKGAYIFDQSKKYKYNIGRNLLVEIVNNEEKEIPLNQLLGWTIIPGIGIQPPTTQTRDGDNILILSDGDMLNLDHNRVIDGDSKNEKKLYENKSGHYLVENDNGKDLVVHNTDYGDVTFHKENDHYNCHRCSDGKRIDSDLITENFIEKIIKTTKENLANNIVSGGANEETKENGETAAETQQNNIAAENKEEINVAEPTIQKEEQENVQEEEKVPEEPAVEKAEENKEEKKDDKPKHDPKKASAFWDTLCGSCMYSATFCAIGSLLGLGVVALPLMIAFACLAMVFKGFSFQGGFGLVADKPVFDDIATNEPVNEKTKDKDLSRSQNKYLDRKNEIETNKNRIATLNNEIADLNQQIENSKIEEKNHIADLEAQYEGLSPAQQQGKLGKELREKIDNYNLRQEMLAEYNSLSQEEKESKAGRKLLEQINKNELRGNPDLYNLNQQLLGKQNTIKSLNDKNEKLDTKNANYLEGTNIKNFIGLVGELEKVDNELVRAPFKDEQFVDAAMFHLLNDNLEKRPSTIHQSLTEDFLSQNTKDFLGNLQIKEVEILEERFDDINEKYGVAQERRMMTSQQEYTKILAEAEKNLGGKTSSELVMYIEKKKEVLSSTYGISAVDYYDKLKPSLETIVGFEKNPELVESKEDALKYKKAKRTLAALKKVSTNENFAELCKTYRHDPELVFAEYGLENPVTKRFDLFQRATDKNYEISYAVETLDEIKNSKSTKELDKKVKKVLESTKDSLQTQYKKAVQAKDKLLKKYPIDYANYKQHYFAGLPVYAKKQQGKSLSAEEKHIYEQSNVVMTAIISQLGQVEYAKLEKKALNKAKKTQGKQYVEEHKDEIIANEQAELFKTYKVKSQKELERKLGAPVIAKFRKNLEKQESLKKQIFKFEEKTETKEKVETAETAKPEKKVPKAETTKENAEEVLVEVNENEQTEEFEKPEILEETNEDSKDKKKYKKPTISIKKDKKAKKNAAVKAIKANLVSEHNVDIDEFKKNEQEIERLKAIPEKDLTKADKINLRNAEAYEKKVKEELGKQEFKRQEDEFVESMLKQYEETHGKNELKKNKNIIIEQAKRNFRAGGAKKLASRLHRISEEQMTKFKEEVDKISALETEADTFAETSIYEEIKEKDTDKKTKKTTKKKANEPIVEKEPVKEELSNTTNEQVVAEQTKEEKKEEQVSKKPVEKAEIKEEPKVEQAKEETLAEKPAEEKTPEQKVRDFLSQKADLEKEQQSFENSARHKNFAHFDSIIQTNTKAMEEYNNAKHLLEMNNSPINQNLVKTCENNIKETEKRFKMGVVKVYGTLAQQGEIQKQYPGKTPDQIAFELYKKDRQTFDQEKANISNKSKNLDLQEQDLRKEIKKFDKTVKNVQKLDSKQKPVEATKPVEKVETKKVEEEIKQEATSGKPVEKIVEDAAKKQAVIEKESKKQEEVAQKEIEKKQILENKLNAEAKINEQKELAEKERQKQEKEYVEEFIKQIKKDQGKDFVKTNNEKLIELAKESFKNGTGLSNKKLGKLSKEEIEKTVNKINYHESEAVVEPYESSAVDDYSQEYADMSDFNQQVQEVAQVKDHIAELHEEPESANNSDFFEKVNAKKQEPKKQNENINPFEGESVYGDGENPFDKIADDAYDDEMKKDDEINKIIDKSNKTFDELQKKNKTKKETGKNK